MLLLTDPVDEFWIPSVGEYKDKNVQVGRPAAAPTCPGSRPQDEPEKPAEDEAAENDLGSLVAVFKLTLADAVKDVRVSERLTDSPVCLVADEGDMDMHLERLLKQHRQLDTSAKRILEVNPTHPLIRRLTDLAAKDGVSDGLEDVRMAAARSGPHRRRRTDPRSRRLRPPLGGDAGEGPADRAGRLKACSAYRPNRTGVRLVGWAVVRRLIAPSSPFQSPT